MSIDQGRTGQGRGWFEEPITEGGDGNVLPADQTMHADTAVGLPPVPEPVYTAAYPQPSYDNAPPQASTPYYVSEQPKPERPSTRLKVAAAIGALAVLVGGAYVAHKELAGSSPSTHSSTSPRVIGQRPSAGGGGNNSQNSGGATHKPNQQPTQQPPETTPAIQKTVLEPNVATYLPIRGSGENGSILRAGEALDAGLSTKEFTPALNVPLRDWLFSHDYRHQFRDFVKYEGIFARTGSSFAKIYNENYAAASQIFNTPIPENIAKYAAGIQGVPKSELPNSSAEFTNFMKQAMGDKLLGKVNTPVIMVENAIRDGNGLNFDPYLTWIDAYARYGNAMADSKYIPNNEVSYLNSYAEKQQLVYSKTGAQGYQPGMGEKYLQIKVDLTSSNLIGVQRYFITGNYYALAVCTYEQYKQNNGSIVSTIGRYLLVPTPETNSQSIMAIKLYSSSNSVPNVPAWLLSK